MSVSYGLAGEAGLGKEGRQMADDKKDKLETEETAVAEEGPVAEETAEAAADAVESEPVDGDETEGAAASEIGDAAAPSEGDSDKVEDEPVDEETSDTTDEPEPDTTEVADEPGEVDEELVEDEPDEVDKEPVDDEKPVDKPVAKATAVKSEKAPESLSGGTPKKDGFLAKKIGMPAIIAHSKSEYFLPRRRILILIANEARMINITFFKVYTNITYLTYHLMISYIY